MNLAPRFYASGGDLIADRRPITLEEAHQTICQWWTLSREYQRLGDWRRAHETRRQADALEAAARDCAKWRRAAGWSDPLEADRQKGRVG